VAEWSIAPVLKTGVSETGPRVRIPPSPHKTLSPEAMALGLFVLPGEVGFERRSRYTRRAERVLVGESGQEPPTRIGVRSTNNYREVS
jgi:hypothetical protein